MVTASELVAMDPDELVSRLDESRKELFNLRFQLATGQLDNPARVRQVRRDVARMLTVMRGREIEEAEAWQEPAPAVASGGAGSTGRAAENEDEEA